MGVETFRRSLGRGHACIVANQEELTICAKKHEHEKEGKFCKEGV
jgi:hypothetical protein